MPDDRPLGELHNPDGQQCQLFMDLSNRRQHGQSRQKDEPQRIHPVDRWSSGFVHPLSLTALQIHSREPVYLASERPPTESGSQQESCRFADHAIKKPGAFWPPGVSSFTIAGLVLRLFLLLFGRSLFLPRRGSGAALLPVAELRLILLLPL